MKRIALIALMTTVISVNSFSQSSNIQKAAKSVFSLTTFKADGSILTTSHGVFVSNDGEAIAPWKPFEGADSAIVITADGKALNVDFIIGVNSIYDVCKFKAEGKTLSASIAANKLNANSKAWLTEYSSGKTNIKQTTIKGAETFMEKFSYYILSNDASEETGGCPLLNDRGEVVALIEQAVSGGIGHAIDASFINNLSANAKMTVMDPNIKKTTIRTQLPPDEQDALVTLLLAAEASTPRNYDKYINDFIRMFPNSVDGYAARARKQLANNNISGAEATMGEAISKASDKANAHFEYSKIIYDRVIYNTDSTFTTWTLDKALAEAREAYNIKQDPSYKHPEARIIYSQGNYKEALDIFTSLTTTTIRNSEIFYEAAQCKQMLNAPKEEIVQLLDSAVAACPQPLTNISAPYFVARGDALIEAGKLRPALADYNKYDTLMMGNASPEFYYKRHKLEISLKQYQQALNDIAHTILLSPREPFYIAEMAALYLRVNQIERAIKSCDLCLSVDDKYADAYIIKGLALIQNKNKEEGLKNLEKAQELGDERAAGLIEKYK